MNTIPAAVVAEEPKRVAPVHRGLASLAHLLSLAQVWLTHSSSYNSNNPGLKTEMEKCSYRDFDFRIGCFLKMLRGCPAPEPLGSITKYVSGP